jgi:hypothetical protein
MRDSYAVKDCPAYLLERYGETFSPHTVRHWIHRGMRSHKLKTTYVGGKVHVTPAAFEEFFSAVSAARNA